MAGSGWEGGWASSHTFHSAGGGRHGWGGSSSSKQQRQTGHMTQVLCNSRIWDSGLGGSGTAQPMDGKEHESSPSPAAFPAAFGIQKPIQVCQVNKGKTKRSSPTNPIKKKLRGWASESVRVITRTGTEVRSTGASTTWHWLAGVARLLLHAAHVVLNLVAQWSSLVKCNENVMTIVSWTPFPYGPTGAYVPYVTYAVRLLRRRTCQSRVTDA